MSEHTADYGALVADLRARLERAVGRLEDKRDDFDTRGSEKVRLGGKVEGVKLALAYLHDETRMLPPTVGRTTTDNTHKGAGDE